MLAEFLAQHTVTINLTVTLCDTEQAQYDTKQAKAPGNRQWCGDQLTVTLCDTAIGTQLLIEQVLPDLVTDPNLDTCQQKVDHTLRV